MYEPANHFSHLLNLALQIISIKRFRVFHTYTLLLRCS